jgi:hypothetical protein
VLSVCEALDGSRSGLYAWLVRSRSQRSPDDEMIGTQVLQSFVSSDCTYDAQRLWHDRARVISLGWCLLSRPQHMALLAVLEK